MNNTENDEFYIKERARKQPDKIVQKILSKKLPNYCEASDRTVLSKNKEDLDKFFQKYFEGHKKLLKILLKNEKVTKLLEIQLLEEEKINDDVNDSSYEEFDFIIENPGSYDTANKPEMSIDNFINFCTLVLEKNHSHNISDKIKTLINELDKFAIVYYYFCFKSDKETGGAEVGPSVEEPADINNIIKKYEESESYLDVWHTFYKNDFTAPKEHILLRPYLYENFTDIDELCEDTSSDLDETDTTDVLGGNSRLPADDDY